MKKLVITGNGFDLVHKLHTRYSDFMDYVWNEDREFYDHLTKYIFEDDLWNDFENALGYFDDRELMEMSNASYLNYADGHNNSHKAINEELSFANKISKIMKEWIQGINTNKEPIVSDKIMNNQNIFINFNYTDILETVYNIPENNICYIHGKGIRDERIIVGHHNTFAYAGKIPLMLTYQEMDEWIEYQMNKTYEDREKEYEIERYFVDTYKDTETIIAMHRENFERLRDVDEVYILGHSLSYVDFAYFEKIHSCILPEIKWYITYHSEKDKRNAYKFIENLGIKAYVIDTFEKLCGKDK